MKKIFWLAVSLYVVLSSAALFAQKANAVKGNDENEGEWRPLDVGEPTPAEESEMGREEHYKQMDDWGEDETSVENIAEDSTLEEREFKEDEF